jgi:hypothetical protein
MSDANQRALADKYLIKTTDNEYDKCRIKAFNTSANGSYTVEQCDSWVFSTQYYSKTVVTDVSSRQRLVSFLKTTAFRFKWSLVCGGEVMKSTLSALYFLGRFGIIFSGFLSDK